MTSHTHLTQLVNASCSFRRATTTQIGRIVELVNSAYRGESSRAGWTTEADLLGGQRTDADEISQLIEQKDSMMLLYFIEDELVGSVHLNKEDAVTSYIGMLVIKPVMQEQGLGSRLMSEAEKIARDQWGIYRMQMQVITVRHELIAYYQRRGYQRTGIFRPFPASDPKFGLPKVDGLLFEVLEKFLD